jgi:hypothetical protein
VRPEACEAGRSDVAVLCCEAERTELAEKENKVKREKLTQK